ncbi:S8 family serine peptidase [Thalassolituus sp.]|uniref:S8 family serine peptidase n=1 Tax=Thalassolituus sp. TaxID=2030822 RepID=UPI003518F085
MKPSKMALVAAVLFSFAIHAAPPDWAQSGGNAEKVTSDLGDWVNAASDDERVRVIVSLEAKIPAGKARAQAIADAQGRVIGAFSNANNGKGLGVMARYRTLFGFSANLTKGQIIALTKRGDVTLIEEMPVHEKHYPQSFPLTDVDLAQGSGNTGVGATIAIIDDGLDTAHGAFAGGKVLGGYDFADFDGDFSNDCAGQSHGTAVAGVAAGNGAGSVGVAPDANIVFLKIQSSSICGSASLDGDIVGAIDWATANQALYGINVISMSLGGGSYSSESNCDGSSSIYFNAIRNANDAGITVIAASGNDGLCDAMSRPACFSDVISVGAVYDEPLGEVGWCISRQSCRRGSRNPGCPNGYRAYFEDAFADNVIVYSNSASFLDVTAPATCALTAAPGGGTTDCFGGTSSATPFVSGVAALAVGSAGAATIAPSNMRALLTETGDNVTDPKNGRVTPRVNGFNAAIAAPTYASGGGGNQSPNASFAYSCSELACNFDASGSADLDGSITSYSWNFGGDGTGSGVTTSHSFSAANTYSVSLTVTDNEGATGADVQQVTVTEATTNQPPTASFTFNCNDLSCDFDGSDSSDSDGSVVSYSWDFGGDGSGSGAVVSHNFSSADTYTVSLTVFDDAGASDDVDQAVTVTATADEISLTVSRTKSRGRHAPTLNWSGASGSSVDLYRGGVLLVTTANDGSYQDFTGNKGGGSYSYQVCEAGSNNCSSTETVVY